MTMIVNPSRFAGSPPALGDYRWYRLNISAVNGDLRVGIDELYASDSIGGADILILGGGSGGTYTASSSFGGFPPENAFDHTQSRAVAGWVNNGGTTGWVRHDLGAGVTRKLKNFGLRPMPSEVNRMPASFKVNYSDDGSSWTNAATFTGLANWAADEIRLYDIPDVGLHRHWEYEITANKGDAYCSVGAIYMIFADGTLARTGIRNCGLKASTVFDTSGTYEAVGTINRATSQYWVSANSPPQTLEFIIPVQLAEFKLKCLEPNRMPRDFTLEGYNLATSTWDVIRTYGPSTAWSIGETRTFTI